MNNEGIVNEDVFQCKMYITDLETGQDSKEINVEDLVFKDWIEFEFGNWGDEDYGTLPYKDFKFFINDYSVTFYSPLVKKLKEERNNYKELYEKEKGKWNELKETLKEEIKYDRNWYNPDCVEYIGQKRYPDDTIDGFMYVVEKMQEIERL